MRIDREQFAPPREATIWEESAHQLAEKLKKECLTEMEMVSQANIMLSQIIKRAEVYMQAIDNAIARGNARLAYDMIRLIFAMIPQERRAEIGMALTLEDAKSIVQLAAKAITPKPDPSPSLLQNKT